MLSLFLLKTVSHKPDFVILQKQNGHHLSGSCITASVYLPTLPDIQKMKLRRAGENSGFIWHFSTQGLPVSFVTKNYRGLLPHIFTFSISIRVVVIFCGTVFSIKNEKRPLTAVLPYAVRTFLFYISKSDDRLTGYKII